MHHPIVPHAFFTLPSELHTHIFTLACTPSRSIYGPTYYSAFQTGIALSLVSRYINAVSVPARYHAVVLSSLREVLGFYNNLSSPRDNRSHFCVRYLTLITDEIPSDPAELVVERSRYPPGVDLDFQPGSRSNNTPAARQQRKRDAGTREQLMLEVISKILRIVEEDLLELEIGFQSIAHFRNPLEYLSACPLFFESSNNSSSSRVPIVHPLVFPNLVAMFYGCPPSGAYPWTPSSVVSTKLSTSSTPNTHRSPFNPPPTFPTTTASVIDILPSSAAAIRSRQPSLICPKLRDLTVVLNDADVSDTTGDSVFHTHHADITLGADNGASLSNPGAHTISYADASLVRDFSAPERGMNRVADDHSPTQFPCLTKLTLLASTPAQALSLVVIDDGDFGTGGAVAAWDVGMSLQGALWMGSPRRNTLTEQEEEENCARQYAWPPRKLRTVVMRPKARWNERWESLREVVRREQQALQGHGIPTDNESKTLTILVLKPGEL